MLQFKNFPIFANYNDFTPEERSTALKKRTKAFYRTAEGIAWQREIEEAKRRRGADNVYDYMPERMAAETDVLDRQRDEIMPDPNSTNAWEGEVVKHLTRIYATGVGNLLFHCLKKTVKVWIVLDQSPEGAAASTTPGEVKAEVGGGVRLYFDPFGFPEDSDRYTAADILFHEMVHAYRSGWMGVNWSNWRKMEQYKDAEEFLAIHLQNVFMHQIGKTKFYISHLDNRIASVRDVYQNIAKRKETMEVLGYYLYREPFVREVAKWKDPPCNVWRDYADIRAMSPFAASLPRVPGP
jgi:hypothetical protein